MKINAVSVGVYTFNGFSDDLKRARKTLQENSALDGYLKDGRTVIIEKVEINENGEKKAKHESLKKVGQGAAAGVAGGATGTVMAKSKNNIHVSGDETESNLDETETADASNLTEDIANDDIAVASSATAETAQSAADDIDEQLADAVNFDVDDEAEAATGIFACFKEFFKSLLDID